MAASERASPITPPEPVKHEIASGQLLVVHLRQLKYASAEGLGALLDARQRLLATGLSLTLASVPSQIKLLLFASCLERFFALAAPIDVFSRMTLSTPGGLTKSWQARAGEVIVP